MRNLCEGSPARGGLGKGKRNVLKRVESNLSSQNDTAAVSTRGEAFARFELYRDFASVETLWRDFESGADLTPYQRYDFLRLWHQHIGKQQGVIPLIAVAFDEHNEPLCLLPLGKFARGPVAIACYLAGKHANYNFGIWRRGVTFSRGFVTRFFEALHRAEPHLAAVELHNQPFSWHGAENPLRQFPHQPSPSLGYRLKLGANGEEVLKRQLTSSYRGRIRGKERKLGRLPGYRYFVARTPEEIARCMDAFFAQKREYMAGMKIPNPFDEPGVTAFLRAAAAEHVLEIHALECEGEVLALYAAVADDKRISTMISSYTASENARYSPGIITISHIVANAAERGYEIMDLGVGEAEYKFVYCDEKEELFDSFLPLSKTGHAIVPLLRAQANLKRFVKTTPALWQAAKAVRGLFAR